MRTPGAGGLLVNDLSSSWLHTLF